MLHILSIRPNYGHTATQYSQVVAKVNAHEHFVRDGADLRAELNISVIEALSGFTRDVHLLNGSTVSLNKTGVRGGFTQSTNEMSFVLVMVVTNLKERKRQGAKRAKQPRRVELLTIIIGIFRCDIAPCDVKHDGTILQVLSIMLVV